MEMGRNVWVGPVNQGNSLSDINNEAVIQILGLNGQQVERSRLLDDIVTYLNLDSFTQQYSVEPAVAASSLGFNSSTQGLGHRIIGGNSLGAGYEAPVPHVISYVDFSPPQVENSLNYAPVSYSTLPVSTHEVSAYGTSSSVEQSGSYQTLTSPGSPHEVSSSSVPVAIQGTRKHACGKAPRPRKREPTAKLYECEEPLSDPEEEKKRVNAINAKKNRDKKKIRLQELENLAASLTAERDSLQTNNNKLRNKCDIFGKKLMTVCQQLNVPVIILPQD